MNEKSSEWTRQTQRENNKQKGKNSGIKGLNVLETINQTDSFLTHKGAKAHVNILLWLMPDNFTHERDKPCPSTSKTVTA